MGIHYYWLLVFELMSLAVQDSTATKFENLVTGGQYYYGSFDACLSIEVPDFKLNGKYCLVRMEFSPWEVSEKWENQTVLSTPGPFESIWSLMKPSNDPRLARKDLVKFAQCIPSGCTHEDLERVLMNYVSPALKEEGITAKFSLAETSCITSKDGASFDVYAITYMSLIGSLFCIVVLISVVHRNLSTEAEGKFKDSWMRSLSIFMIFQKLTALEGHTNIKFLCGTKVLSMILIIFGHRYLMLLYAPAININDLEKKYGDFWETILFNGPTIVNSFLHISGFFTYLKILTDIDKNRPVNVFIYVYYRWFRISVLYAIAIFYSALMMPLIVAGPEWKSEGLTRNNSCRKNWWTHLLYINNYFRDDEECLLPAWYLAVDMQLFAIASVVGYLISKWKALEWPLLSSLLTCALIAPSIITYNAGYGPLIRLFLRYLPSYWREPDYVGSYTKTHMRAAPYIIGMITAKLYDIIRKRDLRINKVTYYAIESIASILACGTILSSWPFFRSYLYPDRIVSAVYSSASKLTWSLAVSLFLLGTSCCGKGLISTILGNKIFLVLSKLTLSVLLIHPIVQYHILLRMRGPFFINASLIAWSTAGDVFVTYIISLVLHLVIEGPIVSLNDYLLKKWYTKRK